MSVIQIDKNGIKTVHNQDVGVGLIYAAASKAVKRGTFFGSDYLKPDKSTASGHSIRRFSGVRGGVKKHFPAPVATDLETLKVRAKKRAEARNVLFNVPKRIPGATQLDDWAQIKADRVIKLNANGETFINEDLQRYAKHCEKINDNA